MAPDAAAAESGAQNVRIKKAQLTKAIHALAQLVAKRSANANPLFSESAESMVLLFTLSYVPDKRKMKPIMLQLPHPLFDEKSDVCFLSKDPQKTYKELLLKQKPTPGLTKVIGLEKLRRNYKTPEQKRALADAFDLFLCDSRVVEMMPKVLGTIFYNKKNKRPIPVRLKVNSPEDALKKAISGTPLRVPSGPCLGIRFGRCSMPEEHLLTNAAAVIAGVLRHVVANPIQSVSVQATDAPALPIWRRPTPPGERLNLKKYRSDTASSAASDTGGAHGSETEDTGSDILSDAGETLSASGIDTGGETLSEPETLEETQSELDSLAGDVDDGFSADKEALPLVQGLKKKRKVRPPPTKEPAEKSDNAAMPPPPKKVKKAKAAR